MKTHIHGVEFFLSDGDKYLGFFYIGILKNSKLASMSMQYQLKDIGVNKVANN